MRRRRLSSSFGLSVILPVTSFLVIYISLTSSRKAFGKRTAWLLPVVKTLVVDKTSMASSSYIYENVSASSDGKGMRCEADEFCGAIK